MRNRWTPSIVPNSGDQNVYLVVDDFGDAGCVYREADVEHTDLETVIADLMSGQYNNPVRIVAFNTAENWADDVSKDVALEIRRRADLAAEDLTSSIDEFVGRYEGYERQLVLKLM
jgi:hypothetical protein